MFNNSKNTNIMKKILLVLAAAAALLTVSCQKGLVEGGSSPDGTAKVSVDLSFPTIQTRAYSDGTTATQLQYAVYEKANGVLTQIGALTHSIAGGNAETINISKKVDFQLVTGRTYTFVFWAAAPSEVGVWTNPYKVSFNPDGAIMTADYTGAVANDERYDAFFASVEKQITGDVQMSVELTRPFAQINIGTSDFEAAQGLKAAPNVSSMTILGAYTSLNLITGAASGKTVENGIKFANGPIAGTGAVKAETFPVNGYDYLAMAYVLADNEKEVVEVQFGYKGDDVVETTRTVGSVPIQRNHRTNMFGQVLTSNASLNIIIVPEYEEPDHNYDQLLFAAAVGGTAVLEDDVTMNLEDIIFVKDAVIKLNGKSIIFEGDPTPVDASKIQRSQLVVRKDAHLTIEGPGTIETTGYGNSPIYVDGGSVTIKGGTFNAQAHPEAILIGSNGGTVTIEGGTFWCYYGGVNNEFALNCNDDAFKSGKAEFIVKGGTFYGFDPANSYADKKDDKNANWVAPGYKSVLVAENQTYEGDKSTGTKYTRNVYMVVPDNAVEIAAPASGETSRAISKAIADFKNSTETELTVLLSQPGEYSLKPTSNSQQLDWPSDKKLTFIGTGKDVVLTDGDWVSAAAGYEVEIRDLTLKVFENGSNHTSLGFPGAAKVTMTNVDVYGELDIKSGEVTITNCNFYYAGGATNTKPRWGIYFNGPATATIVGCTFDNSCKENPAVETQGVCVTGGWNDASATEVGDIEIRDCEFKVSRGAPQKALVHITSDFAKSCGTVTIANTTFEGYKKLWEEVDNDTSNKPTQKYKVCVDGVKVQ